MLTGLNSSSSRFFPFTYLKALWRKCLKSVEVFLMSLTSEGIFGGSCCFWLPRLVSGNPD